MIGPAEKLVYGKGLIGPAEKKLVYGNGLIGPAPKISAIGKTYSIPEETGSGSFHFGTDGKHYISYEVNKYHIKFDDKKRFPLRFFFEYCRW